MITVTLKDGQTICFTDDSYTDYMVEDEFFTVVNVDRVIGLINKHDILMVIVK